MLVERVNRFLNSALTIFCNEHGASLVSQEVILMSLYVWNSTPVPVTNISCSILVVGREFQFPINYSAQKHSKLTNNPEDVTTFVSERATLFSACQKVGTELIHDHRLYHRKYINKRCPVPQTYTVGDHIFAERSVKSDAKKGSASELQLCPIT